jgi:hypothetical protein
MVNGEAVYAWDEWDVRNQAAPSFRVVLANEGGILGEDLTASVAPELVGVYPWVDSAGRPFLPWSIDRSRDVGDLWNWKVGRGAAIDVEAAALDWLITDTRKVPPEFDHPKHQAIRSLFNGK